jgi:hypothetical protein
MKGLGIRRLAVSLGALLAALVPCWGDEPVPFPHGDSLWNSYQSEADRLYRDARPDPAAALVLRDGSLFDRLKQAEPLVQIDFPDFRPGQTLFPDFTMGRKARNLAELPEPIVGPKQDKFQTRATWDRDQLQKALDLYELAARCVEPFRPGDMRYCDSREGVARVLGQLHAESGGAPIDRAIRLARESLRDRRVVQGDSDYDVGATYQLIAELEAAAQRTSDAQNSYQKAIRIFELSSESFRPGVGGALRSCARIIRRGDDRAHFALYRAALDALTGQLSVNPGAQDLLLEYLDVIDEYFVMAIAGERGALATIHESLMRVAMARARSAPKGNDKVSPLEQNCYEAARKVGLAYGEAQGHFYAGRALFAWAKRNLEAGELDVSIYDRFDRAYAEFSKPMEDYWVVRPPRTKAEVDNLKDIAQSARQETLSVIQDYLRLADRWGSRSIMPAFREIDLYERISDKVATAPEQIRFLLQAYVAHHRADHERDLGNDAKAVGYYDEAINRLEAPKSGVGDLREALIERLRVLEGVVDILTKDPTKARKPYEDKIKIVKALLKAAPK